MSLLYKLCYGERHTNMQIQGLPYAYAYLLKHCFIALHRTLVPEQNPMINIASFSCVYLRSVHLIEVSFIL